MTHAGTMEDEDEDEDAAVCSSDAEAAGGGSGHSPGRKRACSRGNSITSYPSLRFGGGGIKIN